MGISDRKIEGGPLKGVYIANFSTPVITNVGEKVDVELQDQTTRNFCWYLKRTLNSFTLAAPISAGDYQFTAQAGHSIVIGNYLTALENGLPWQMKVTNVVGNTITVDSFAPNAYTTGATVNRTSIEMNVNGSMANPVIFHISPTGNIQWDITNVIFTIISAGGMDDSFFGDQAALTNGVLVRKKLNATGTFYNIMNPKSNGAFREFFGKAEYTAKAGGGSYSFVSYHLFGSHAGYGTVVRLDGRLGDSFQVVIQDNLTALTSFHATVVGHETD